MDDAKRWVDDLAQLRQVELGHDAAALREVGQPLDCGDDLAQQPFADVGSLLVGIPSADLLEVGDRRRGEGDA